MCCAIPTFEACSLCNVPKASLINTSPKEAQYFPSSGSFLDSALLFKSSNLVFSTNRTSPACRLSTACSSSSPLVTGTKIISWPNSFANSSATILKDFC